MGVAILAEVVATSALKASEGFTRIFPATLSLAGYAIAFFCLAQALRTIPLGQAYAIWSGAGILLLVAIGWILFRQPLSVAESVGIALIIAGIVLLRWNPAFRFRT